MAKILLVDDSSMARQTLRRILDDTGHEVLEAADGLAALECYALEKPDLVFLDLTMPGMPGLEVLETLRRMDASAKIIVATADVQTITTRLAEKAGASGYITKPFRANIVLDVLDSVLADKRSALTRSPQLMAGVNDATE